MAEDMETILRKSLDAVDRSQRWQMAGLVIFLLLVLLHLVAFITALHGGHEIPTGTAATPGMT